MNRIAALWQQKRHMDLPVLVQEMRIRQRGMRQFVITLVYMLALSIIALALSYEVASEAVEPSRLSALGQRLFMLLALAQLAVVCLVVPVYSSTIVSSEREKGTFELLALTMLSSGGIIRQKLSAATVEVLMLALTSLPVLGLAFMFGGVAPLQMVLAYGILVVTAVLLGSYGVLCSCLLSNSKSATFIAYLGMFAFMLILPVGAEWLKSVSHNGLMDSASTFPYVFVGLLLFVGGLGALALYSLASVILKPRMNVWHTRAFRMAVFGACYVVILLLIGVPSLSELALRLLFGIDDQVSLPMFVNPFVALMSLDDSPAYPQRAAIVIATGVFGIMCTYLFLNLSVRRFSILRRS